MEYDDEEFKAGICDEDNWEHAANVAVRRLVAAVLSEEGWSDPERRSFVSLWTRPVTSGWHCCRGRADLPIEPKKLFDFVRDPDYRAHCDENYQGSIKIQDFSHEVSLILINQKMPSPLEDREAICLHVVRQISPTEWVAVDTSVERPDVPIAKGMTRMEIILGGIHIRANEKHPDVCEVTFIQHGDPKLPQMLNVGFLERIFTTGNTFGHFRGLRRWMGVDEDAGEGAVVLQNDMDVFNNKLNPLRAVGEVFSYVTRVLK